MYRLTEVLFRGLCSTD